MLVDTGSDGLHGHLDLSEANLFLKRQKTWIFCSIPWVCISAECQKVIDIKKEIFIDFWSAFCSTGCKIFFDRLEYTTSSFLCIWNSRPLHPAIPYPMAKTGQQTCTFNRNPFSWMKIVEKKILHHFPKKRKIQKQLLKKE